MTAPQSLSDQVLALPSGAGGVQGLGETFSADPYTGTGRFQVPIQTPAGHDGLTPRLALVYSSGAGAGVCGVGWSFGVGSVRRRTNKGIPTFTDADVFVLGDDELVPLADGAFVRRSEGAFSRIRRVRQGRTEFWAVTDTDGTRRLYGRNAAERDGDATHVTAWHLSEIRSPNDNAVVFTHTRDEKGLRAYLAQVDWGNGAYRAVLTYGPRPDVLRSARSGLAEVTDRRLSRVEVQVRRSTDGAYTTFDRYDLGYDLSPVTGLSRLRTVTRTGTGSDDATRIWPVLSLGYTEPTARTRVTDVQGHAGRSLADPDLSLVDMTGDGLPDLLQSTSSGYLLRRNRGDGTLAAPLPIPGPGQRLREQGAFLSDMRGEGFADLVTPTGFFPNLGQGFGAFEAFRERPSFDLEDPDTRLVDLDGDGVGDVLITHGDRLTWFRNTGEGAWEPPRVVPDPRALPRLSDPWTRLADIDGDGLADLVRVSLGGLDIYPNLGRGRFGERRWLSFPERLLPTTQPHQVQLVDATGTGASDVLVRMANETWLFANGCGARFEKKVVFRTRSLGEAAAIEAVDLFGTGVKGLLFTQAGGKGAWTYYALWQDVKPDVLATVDNGMGALTEVRYGSSVAHASRDLRAARPWRFPLPYPVMVVDAVTTTDATTGMTVGQRFAYHDGYHDGVEREFRGFGHVEQWDTEKSAAGTDTSPPSRAVRFFDLGNGHRFLDRYTPFPGELPKDAIPNAPGARRALRGVLVREELYGEDGTTFRARPYTVTHHGYAVRRVAGPPPGGEGSFHAARATTDMVHFERSYDFRRLTQAFTYDKLGRLVEQREKGQGRRGSPTNAVETQQAQALERYTTTAYLLRDEAEPAGPSGYDAPYVPAFLADRPAVVETFGVTGEGDVLLSRERRFYDGDTYENGDYQGLGYPGSGTVAGVVRGRLSCKLVLAFPEGLLDATFPTGSGADAALSARGQYLDDDGDLYLHAERAKYTARGLVAGALDPRGHESTFAYDATHGLFPVTFVDPAGHPTSLTRGDFPHQVVAVVDANANRTAFTYDPSGLPAAKAVMGKLVSGNWQGDPTNHPTEQYAYDFTTTPVTIVVKTRQERLGATFDVTRYVDGLGRTIQERHTAEPDAGAPSTPRWRVTGWQVFNHKGLVIRAYQPVFGATVDYAAGDTETAFVATTYDPLGRPLRVDYPDGTFETTTYGPWVQAFFDRNDNGGHLTAEDPRYGDRLATWTDHLATPTRKYVDAVGREIGVAEDAGEEGSATPTFRITTYEVRSGQFTGTTYDLVLENPLSSNYFVMISGSINHANPPADNVGVRVIQDPFGTGSLAASSGANVLRLERGDDDEDDWQGSVTVWECLGDAGTSGFHLVDVLTVSAAAETSPGPQTTNATANTAWTALSQVALYGGPRGGGSTLAAGDDSDWPSLAGKLVPSGTNAVALTRHAGAEVLLAASFTVYVVQWGTEHTIQRVSVTGNAGGTGVNDPSHYDTAEVIPVDRAQTWCWFSGTTEEDGEGKAFSGLVLALGDGAAQGATETTVAVGCHYAVEKDVLVTVHTHPAFAVDWRFQALGHGMDTVIDVEVDDASEPESEEEYDETPNPRLTRGHRAAVHTVAGAGTSASYDDVLFLLRHTAADTLTTIRRNAHGDFAAWAQSLDTLRVTFTPRRPHTTRSVLDLKDQVVEVHDARVLGFPTWVFTYDLAGRRTVSAHATALGTRFALADAAGSPIWSRDARQIEVDRTFDELNRPLEESSTAASTTKRRRMWSYVAYDDEDPDFATHQSKNLFGRVEEARDADGLRFFEYDWRGLVTKTSHRFWDTTSGGKDWSDPTADFWTTDWDPEVVATARGSIASWLVLDDLTDTTTVAVTTTYDAAGRPVEVSYPEGMKTRATYNAAGQLAQVEADRGAGAGWQAVVEGFTYNARGQVMGYTHGNGAQTSRDYDADIERLTRIYTTLPGSPQTDFQDLHYTYDPVGNPLAIEDALSESAFTANQLIPNTRTFGYDARYRLVKATGKKHNTVVRKGPLDAIPSPDPNDYVPYTVKYAYDEAGNFRRNQEYAWGPIFYKAGRIDLFNGDGTENLDADPTSGNYTYDENGNTLHTPRQQELRYTHDNQARYADMGGGTELRYLRHADQRVLRFVNKSGVQALGVYLGPWEYHRRIGSTSYTKTMLSVEGHGRHAQLERVLDGTDPDSLAVFYVHTDHLGSGHVLTDDSGDLLSQEEYFPYGRASDRRDARNRYRFIGVERDEDTTLCMTGPRTYDPVVGRFLQGDPDAGTSRYPSPFGYSSGNPLKVFDRSGYSETYIETNEAGDVQLVTESDIVVEVRGRQRERGKGPKNAAPAATENGKAAATSPWIATLPPLGLPTEPWSDPWPDSPTLVPRQGPSSPKPPTTPGPSIAQRPAGVVALVLALVWPSDTQEPWMDAADPRTGQPFQSKEDYEAWKSAGRPGEPALETHKKDKWYGYNNRDFQKWYHRQWKEPGAPDATKEEIEEAWRVWNDLERPGPEEQ